MESDMLTPRHPDYSGEAASGVEQSRVLDRIGDIARTAERTAEVIQAFIDRFHGNDRNSAQNSDKPAPLIGHASQLERLSKAVQEADDLARALGEIG